MFDSKKAVCIVINGDVEGWAVAIDDHVLYTKFTIDEYLADKQATREQCKFYTWQEFCDVQDAYHREKYLSDPVQISRAHFDDKLEVLPPVNWVHESGFTHFRMSERLTGTITEQLAGFNGVYLSKNIDICDKSTWIKIDDFAGLKPFDKEADEKGFYI